MTVCYNNYIFFILGITSILKETPTKYELFKLLFGIRHKWYDIGLSLQVCRNVLDSLKQLEFHNVIKLNEVINIWKETQPSPDTWETVITTIKSPIVDDKVTADLICQYLSTGKSNKLLLLINEVINSGVQTTTVKCIQFSYNQHCSHTMYIS